MLVSRTKPCISESPHLQESARLITSDENCRNYFAVSELDTLAKCQANTV